MKKNKIINDFYNISNRIKKIDRLYEIVYNRDKKCFEVYINNDFCFKIGEKLNNLALKKAYETHIRRKNAILEQMERENERLKQIEDENVTRKAKFDLKNMIDFASKTGKNENFYNINLTKWF